MNGAGRRFKSDQEKKPHRENSTPDPCQILNSESLFFRAQFVSRTLRVMPSTAYTHFEEAKKQRSDAYGQTPAFSTFKKSPPLLGKPFPDPAPWIETAKKWENKLPSQSDLQRSPREKPP